MLSGLNNEDWSKNVSIQENQFKVRKLGMPLKSREPAYHQTIFIQIVHALTSHFLEMCMVFRLFLATVTI